MEVDVGEHVAALGVIAKAHMVKCDVSFYVFQRDGIWLVDDLHRRIHHLDKPLNAGHPPLKLLGEFHNAANGGEQGGDVQQIGSQISWGNAAIYEKERTYYHNSDVHNAVKHSGGALKACHVLIHFLFDGQKPVVAPLELLLFHLFIGKGFDNPHS